MQVIAPLSSADIQKKFTFFWISLIFYINLHNSYKFHMAFSFSFFDQPSPGDPTPLPDSASPREAGIEKADPLPWMQHEEMTAHSSTVAGPVTGGLAALAVQQSTAVPLAPPSRKLASYMPPGSAIAAGFAIAAQASAGMPSEPLSNPPVSAPVASHFNAVQSLQGRDLAQLRMDLEREIEQVRQDLFGAAMGVSALKDRLDDLETTVARPLASSPAFSASEVELLMRHWLDVHLPPFIHQAVQRTLDQALEQTVASLSSTEFFRMPVHAPGLPADAFLSQAPQILSSTLP